MQVTVIRVFSTCFHDEYMCLMVHFPLFPQSIAGIRPADFFYKTPSQSGTVRILVGVKIINSPVIYAILISAPRSVVMFSPDDHVRYPYFPVTRALLLNFTLKEKESYKVSE
ncbi:hypothetical protein TBC1_12595 [Lentimicrobium saccharophilum]|uniref:Uncharacterized protein n=1 Tax=Lentimicrobium saccharophilum TaxID=1678841 RepID=A0A0S7C643_9BACT|nr:hypothetical protein TBC1_12595 [Lentimicrobium saccharophilum]